MLLIAETLTEMRQVVGKELYHAEVCFYISIPELKELLNLEKCLFIFYKKQNRYYTSCLTNVLFFLNFPFFDFS